MSTCSVKQALAESPLNRLDSEVLLAHVLGVERSVLYAYPEKLIAIDAFLALCARRKVGEPIAYILGKKDFWQSTFFVNEHVLIPRPETELLVDTILSKFSEKQTVKIAELGTGSGAIALSLAEARPEWELVATDVSAPALQVAKQNVTSLGVGNVTLFQGDWCDALPDQAFDVIVSNPPYIAEDDPHVAQGDLRFEPKSALVAGAAGLADIQKIAAQAKAYLKPSGFLLFEHGYQQAAAVAHVFESLGYQCVTCLQDLAGLDRVSFAVCPVAAV